jgi:hypothetical protein
MGKRMTSEIVRIATCLATILPIGCSTMYSARISVARPEGAPFTQQEQDRARAIVVEMGRAERFWEVDPLPMLAEPSSYEYLPFVRLSGKDSEQDTVAISGLMRQDRREIVISVGDPDRGEPLPRTQKLVNDIRVALVRAFPDSQVDVETRNTPRIFGP